MFFLLGLPIRLIKLALSLVRAALGIALIPLKIVRGVLRGIFGRGKKDDEK